MVSAYGADAVTPVMRSPGAYDVAIDVGGGSRGTSLGDWHDEAGIVTAESSRTISTSHNHDSLWRRPALRNIFSSDGGIAEDI